MVLGIYGASGLGQEVNVIAKKINREMHRWDEIVFIDDINELHDINGQKMVRFNDLLKMYSELEIVIAVGEPSVREKMYQIIKENNVPLATLIHPGVYIDSTTVVEEGSVICEGVTITCNVCIGKNVYVQPHAVIGHDIKIGMHSIIGASCVIGGRNIIGKRVYLGSLAGTKEKLKIGDDVICSAGAMVFRDLPDGVIAVGNPARIMKNNEEKKVFKE